MRTIRIIIGLICAAFLLVSNRARAFDYSVPDHWGYRQLLEELEIRGRAPLLKGYGPYSYQEIAALIDNLPKEEWRLNHSAALNAFNPGHDALLFINPRAAGNLGSDTLDGRLYNRTFGGINIGQGHWSMAGAYYMLAGEQPAAGYYKKLWRGFSGGSDQMYLRYSSSRGYFQIGKDHLSLGSGLVLSGHQAFEKGQAEYRLNKHLKIFFFTGQLDKMADSPAVYNRYLAGHRAELTFGRVQLGFNEFAIYGGEGRNIEPYYLLPFYIFQAEQLNKLYVDDNVIWDMDIKAVLPPFRFRAELMVDDFQIDSESPTDNEPTQAGFLAQADWAVLDRPFFATASIKYQMVTDWTFNQPNIWNRFLFEGQPLGGEYGNDYDRLSLGASLVTGRDRGSLEIYHRRKGQGSIDQPWNEPWVNDTTWQGRFPTGTVERAMGAIFAMSHYLGHWDPLAIGGDYYLVAETGWERTENLHHSAGATGTSWQIRLGLEASFWSDVFRID
ncbi:MAG: hypothetical protein RDU76_11025 [Candidatus Edwardsbacteria bacterium]|nr:hypothetical protein [Candidatus Edwardsbacteria bacterium]